MRLGNMWFEFSTPYKNDLIVDILLFINLEIITMVQCTKLDSKSLNVYKSIHKKHMYIYCTYQAQNLTILATW